MGREIKFTVVAVYVNDGLGWSDCPLIHLDTLEQAESFITDGGGKDFDDLRIDKLYRKTEGIQNG